MTKVQSGIHWTEPTHCCILWGQLDSDPLKVLAVKGMSKCHHDSGLEIEERGSVEQMSFVPLSFCKGKGQWNKQCHLSFHPQISFSLLLPYLLLTCSQCMLILDSYSGKVTKWTFVLFSELKCVRKAKELLWGREYKEAKW